VDVGECVVQSIACPEKSQLAHPWRINQHGTVIQHKQLASGSRMDAFSRLADGSCVICVTANQPID
jgi:hypothetical protein